MADDKTDIAKVAKCVEALDGPDRLTDANIHWLIEREQFDSDEGYDKPNYCYARSGWTLNRADLFHLSSIGVPPYTASIDAGMTLVPDGWGWNISQPNAKAVASGLLKKRTPCSGEVQNGCEDRYAVAGATPALALCAAALRARSRRGEG